MSESCAPVCKFTRSIPMQSFGSELLEHGFVSSQKSTLARTMDHLPSLTILIPTYNRAEALSQTLDALVNVDRTEIDCAIVVIDNNFTDNTAEVVKEYETQLPLSYLKEPRPGKNCALNKALRECDLKDIVVFTDDDVTPARNWLQEIVSSVRKRPRIAVFGGKVELMWPDNKQPEWAMRDWMMGFAFTRHHYAEGETFY